MKQAHIFIDGRVQGVGFRYFTKTNARDLGVKGWVKNLPDGRVEAVFEGDEERVQELIDRCKRGPRSARVDDLNVEWVSSTGKFNSFDVAYF